MINENSRVTVDSNGNIKIVSTLDPNTISSSMDGKYNSHFNKTDQTYLDDLFFRKNNNIALLNARSAIRKNDVLLTKVKDVEEFNKTIPSKLNETELI